MIRLVSEKKNFFLNDLRCGPLTRFTPVITLLTFALGTLLLAQLASKDSGKAERGGL